MHISGPHLARSSRTCMKPIDIQLEVMMAGARLKPERSTAQPQEAYRDPARGIRYEREKLVKRKSKGKRK
jgi:hypothetical protein